MSRRRKGAAPATPTGGEGLTPAAILELDEPVHCWFGLTYSNYLVLQRSIMQSMPVEWQRQMVALLRQADDRFGQLQICPSFLVRGRDGGRFIHDPLADYQRGRRNLNHELSHAPHLPR